MPHRALALLLLALLSPPAAARAAEEEAAQPVPGREKTARTRVLEAGAALLQGSPLGRFDVYLVGFHPLREDPSQQMEAHHFCEQVNEDFAQCVLFDAGDDDARMNGVEYIISASLFERLPEAERRYWHPHNFEILSGQLVGPGLPQAAELELMRGKMNSYGKTFHVWHTGAGEASGDDLPLGPARLAWSFNRIGEADPALVERRARRLEIDGERIRRERRELLPLARPQFGVDALRDAFPGPTRELEGVVDAEAAAQPAGAREGAAPQAP